MTAALIALCMVGQIGYGLLPSVQQTRRNQALFRAIHANDAGAVRRAIAAGADPHAVYVPLSWQEQRTPGWKRWWRRMNGVRYPRPKPVSALQEAVTGWHDPITQHWVTPPENIALIQALLDAGADADSRTDGSDTSLLSVAAFAARPATVRLLLKHGAKVNACDSEGLSPLMWAAMTGDPETIRLLLERGASVNLQDSSGATALFWSSSLIPIVQPPNKRAMVARLLLTHGANARLKNSSGMTALDAARRKQILRPANPSLPPLIAILERRH